MVSLSFRVRGTLVFRVKCSEKRAKVKQNEFLVSKETVVLRRWERSKQKFGFIKRVDKTKFLFKSETGFSLSERRYATVLTLKRLNVCRPQSPVKGTCSSYGGKVFRSH